MASNPFLSGLMSGYLGTGTGNPKQQGLLQQIMQKAGSKKPQGVGPQTPTVPTGPTTNADPMSIDNTNPMGG